MRTFFYNSATGMLMIFLLLLTVPPIAQAQTVSELQGKIGSNQKEITTLEKDIQKYQIQLTSIGKTKNTLKNTVRELDISRKKVSTSISLARRKIQRSSQTIVNLQKDIAENTKKVLQQEKTLAETVRQINSTDQITFIEALLSTNTISIFWNDMENLQKIQITIRHEVATLVAQKKSLQSTEKRKKGVHKELVLHKTELSTQRHSLDINRSAKKALLKETSNRESTYQKLLASKKKAKREFETQLRSFEEQLKYVLDPSSIPPAGKGVLQWPLKHVRITQYFGNTRFASSGAYNGKGHNGIDLAASVGTPVLAALAGNVRATGNTDLYKGCYSYGKWVLLEHVNGISTLYGHLSEIRVRKGEAVATGEIIAYSGKTGYVTGPHLHFSTFVSNAVKIVRLGDIKKITHCPDARIPVAAWSGYLNPIDYLK